MSQSAQMPAGGQHLPLGRIAAVTFVTLALAITAAVVVAVRSDSHHRASSSAVTSAQSSIQSSAPPAAPAPANAVPAPPLTVYVVGTSADQQRAYSELDGDPLYHFNADVVVLPPGDDADVLNLPSEYPNNRVWIVDLRQSQSIPADAQGGQAEATGIQEADTQVVTRPAHLLTLYVVATLADQDQVNSELEGDPLYQGMGLAIVISPGDESDLEALPSDFPNQQVSIVDLRDQQ